MSFRALEGEQSGLAVEAMLAALIDDWDENPDEPVVRNKYLRYINRAIRKIHISDPRRKVFVVVDAEAPLLAGVGQYLVTEIPSNGGFGWSDCFEVLRLRNSQDGRPLETQDLESFRERQLNLATDDGAPTIMVPIDGQRVQVWPTPSADGMLLGEYYTELPSLTGVPGSQLEWPRSWDEVILAGAHYFVALHKFADQPANVVLFKREFDDLMAAVEQQDQVTLERPGRCVVTRNLRSVRQGPPRDRSIDWRY